MQPQQLIRGILCRRFRIKKVSLYYIAVHLSLGRFPGKLGSGLLSGRP
jgi:hypothetical protein